MNDDNELGHYFDGVGVCIYCNACQDPSCCRRAAEPCDKSVLKATQQSAERIREQFKREGRI